MAADNPSQHWSRGSACRRSKDGCTKQLVFQAGEKVQMVDVDEKKEGKEGHWYEGKEQGTLEEESVTLHSFHAWILEEERNCERRLSGTQLGEGWHAGSLQAATGKEEAPSAALLT